MNVNGTWSIYWLHHKAKSLLPTAPRTVDLPLKLDDEQLSLSLEILDYGTFAPIMQLKMMHLSCWNVPYITPLEISSHHYLRRSSRNLKSFFQLDHQVDISLYLTEATTPRHSRELAGLKPSSCTFNPISLFGFPDFEIKFNCIILLSTYPQKIPLEPTCLH